MPRLAIVSSVDSQTACARVLHQPEGVLSGWLPVLALWAGNGWGLVCLPAPGDQVLVLSHDGDPASGIILGGLYSDARRVPSAPIGEFWLVHSSGSSLKMVNDGTVQISGDLHVSGDVYDKSGSLSRLRQAHNAHVHTDAVGRATSAPTTRD
ncbi:MAG: phage baseplate assembly protein V [Acetobacteraceae bacterium]|nr:phage baseplate assembly protein V [Acetobacteraceae bacterium]